MTFKGYPLSTLALLTDVIYEYCRKDLDLLLSFNDLLKRIEKRTGKVPKPGVAAWIKKLQHVLKRMLPEATMHKNIRDLKAPVLFVNKRSRKSWKYYEFLITTGPHDFYRLKTSIKTGDLSIPPEALISLKKSKIFPAFRRIRRIGLQEPRVEKGTYNDIIFMGACLYTSFIDVWRLLKGLSKIYFGYYTPVHIAKGLLAVRPVAFEGIIKSQYFISGGIVAEVKAERGHERILVYASLLDSPAYRDLENGHLCEKEEPLIFLGLAPIGPPPYAWEGPPVFIALYTVKVHDVDKMMYKLLSSGKEPLLEIKEPSLAPSAVEVAQEIEKRQPHQLVLKSEVKNFVNAYRDKLLKGKVSVKELFDINYGIQASYAMRLWRESYNKAKRAKKIERIIHAILWIAYDRGAVRVPRRALL